MHEIASQFIFISKNFRGNMLPPRKLVAFNQLGLLPQTINPRKNPDYGLRWCWGACDVIQDNRHIGF